MLRHSAQPSSASSTTKPSGGIKTMKDTPNTYDNAKSKSSPMVSKIYWAIICMASFCVAIGLYSNQLHVDFNLLQPSIENVDRASENAAFQAIFERVLKHERSCNKLGLSKQKENFLMNNHTAHLPQYGFLDELRKYRKKNARDIDHAYPYKCMLPPESECDETQFTVVFMAYNPDRMEKLFRQIKKMLTDNDFSKIVKEVIIVWNGERHVDESELGKNLVKLSENLPLRISYPLKEGFPNDLMNRYHPRLDIETKAILYYDDDGPFYTYRAILGGFELWKRNANAQIGAMARKLDLGPRQAEESKAVSTVPNDRFFVSHCPSDELNYNYFTFANFDARMILPSGSFLHSNFLCFLWHPIFEDVRKYVRNHPVHPDDGTVSMIVSQLAGRAPKVYPRRINDGEKKQETLQQSGKRRRLMDGMNWDKPGAHDQKMMWGRLRGDVANSLARYFGSVNSGSLGWCNGTEYHKVKRKENICVPEMASVGMLPWMNGDHKASDVCP